MANLHGILPQGTTHRKILFLRERRQTATRGLIYYGPIVAMEKGLPLWTRSVTSHPALKALQWGGLLFPSSPTPGVVTVLSYHGPRETLTLDARERQLVEHHETYALYASRAVWVQGQWGSSEDLSYRRRGYGRDRSPSLSLPVSSQENLKASWAFSLRHRLQSNVFHLYWVRLLREIQLEDVKASS